MAVMLEGVANKVAFLVVLCSVLCWVAFVVGFGIRHQQVDIGQNSTTVQSNYFSYWCLATSAIPVYVTTFTHLLCGNVCTAVTVLFLFPIFLVSAGGVLERDGDLLYRYYTEAGLDFADYIPVEFGGALGAVFFYWLSLLLWVCHSYNKGKRSSYEVIN